MAFVVISTNADSQAETKILHDETKLRSAEQLEARFGYGLKAKILVHDERNARGVRKKMNADLSPRSDADEHTGSCTPIWHLSLGIASQGFPILQSDSPSREIASRMVYSPSGRFPPTIPLRSAANENTPPFYLDTRAMPLQFPFAPLMWMPFSYDEL
jgi:hypothetical protein